MSFGESNARLAAVASDRTAEFKSLLIDAGKQNEAESLLGAYGYMSRKTGRNIAVSINSTARTWMLSARSPDNKTKPLAKGEMREAAKLLSGKFTTIPPGAWVSGRRIRFHIVAFEQ